VTVTARFLSAFWRLRSGDASVLVSAGASNAAAAAKDLLFSPFTTSLRLPSRADKLLTMLHKTLKRPFASLDRVAGDHHAAGKSASLPGPSKKSLHLPQSVLILCH